MQIKIDFNCVAILETFPGGIYLTHIENANQLGFEDAVIMQSDEHLHQPCISL